MTEINLCSMPFLSIDYSNVIDFESKASRDDYFRKNTIRTIEGNIKYDNARQYINVNLNMEYVRNFDYLFFKDGNDDKNYFYFIIDTEMKTKNNTNIYIKLDVWTTYMFNYSILPSFVDRCHVDRWNGDIPTYNLEDEGIEKGEIIQVEEPQDIATMGKAIIISASVPIGYVEKPGGNGATGGGTGTMWKDGVLSAQGFRFIKGMEGFGNKPYQDSGGYWTVGYGVTKFAEPDVYDKIVSMNPIEEEECAKISFKLKNERYGSKIVSTCVKFGISKQYQFDALLSLAYNAGVGSVTGDNSLTRALAKDITDESTIRPIWENFIVTSNGIPSEGLKTLRREQCNMFFGKEFEIRKIMYVPNFDGHVTENNGNGWLPTDYTNEAGDLDGYKSFNNEYGDNWLCPVKNATVTSKYGWRVHPITGEKKFHAGTDIGLATGKPTVASKTGIIAETGFHSSMGNFIYLDCGDYRVKYMHLSKILVTKGQAVSRGEKIGEIGSTGGSTGPHCHWEIIKISTNESTDPAPILKVGDKV